MITLEDCTRLFECFSHSLIAYTDTFIFIADQKSNTCFLLSDCNCLLDIQCKVLERLSRVAYKTEPYDSFIENHKLHKKLLTGINAYLNTSFTEKDMEQIYTYLGNCCNHQKTIDFIMSNYDMSMLIKNKELDSYEKQ